MVLALGTIPRTILFYSLFRIQFIAVLSFFFCVCVLLEIYLKHLITSHRAWAEATGPLFCTQNQLLVAARSPNVQGQFKYSSQCSTLPPNCLFRNRSSNPITSLRWRICCPGYGIRIVNLFLPGDAFCTCRRVKQHTKVNHLPEDLAGGWFMSLAQIAMPGLLLSEKFVFLGQIQTTRFLPGCDLTSLSCVCHTVPHAFSRLSKVSPSYKKVVFLPG